MEKRHFDIVVIGSGIAGLSAAKTAADLGAKVAIITKGAIKESSTQYAQGGIAAVMTQDDTPKLHLEDTLNSGAGLCNEEAVKILVEEGPERVHELIRIGADFDKTGDTYHYAQEGAHSRRRILHAGDSTGREIEKTLGLYLLNSPNATFISHTFATKLIVEDDTCLGCVAIHQGEPLFFAAKAVILATGGCGQVYARNTNPPVATGDGMMLGYHAGATLQDMEFFQFHPTTLYSGDKKPISLFLISEAVRGEGAILRNSFGERFMPDYDPLAELAVRDIVSRAIFKECQKTKASHVYLDLTHLDLDIPKRFPTIYQRVLSAGIDMGKDLIPVAPAAHYFMGGIQTDTNGLTSVKNLYAAGETACLGLHGANRLASNSLLDGLVFGHRAAEHALLSSYSAPSRLPILPHLPVHTDMALLSKALIAKQAIRQTMWEDVGIVRNETGLLKALASFKEHDWLMQENTWNPALREIQGLYELAKIITEFALKRTESRGGHFREDFPQTQSPAWQHHLTISPCRTVS